MVIVLYKTFFSAFYIYLFGLFGSLFFSDKSSKTDIFEKIFIGFTLMGCVSLTLNFFFPLSNYINSLFFILLILSLFIFKKNINKKKNYL